MLNMICSFGFVGAIFGTVSIAYILFITVMFVIYKRTGGKKNYWDYMGLW